VEGKQGKGAGLLVSVGGVRVVFASARVIELLQWGCRGSEVHTEKFDHKFR
jgi:hypothetical protein